MVNLNTKAMRYLSGDDFRVLTAVEIGSKNHEIVPTNIIVKISHLRSGTAQKAIGNLLKFKLLASSPSSSYDGFRLTYAGLDHLALKAFAKRDTVYSVGNQIGVGKESDVYVVADKTGKQYILKLHRLGRISFRSVKNNRDYLKKRKSASWMYLSRLAAEREYAYMKVLHDSGFPVPVPRDQNRHCVVMELVDAFPLRNIEVVLQPDQLYARLMSLISEMANSGLIHSDYNEFNILVSEDGSPTLIDFPQMVSIDHDNAPFYFDRDVRCIRDYFEKKLRFIGETWPKFKEITRVSDLDRQVEASGCFSKHQIKEYERGKAVVEKDPQLDNETCFTTERSDRDATSSASEQDDRSSSESDDTNDVQSNVSNY